MLELLLLGSLPAGAWALERMRRRQHERRHAAFLASLSAELQVALHVANHEAAARRQPLTSLHLAYGLLQDEEFTGLVTQLGGDPAAIEDRIIAALDQLGLPETEPAATREALETLGYISAVARFHQRTATPTDLWTRLARSPAGAVFEAAGLPPHRLLFALVHGAEPAAPLLASSQGELAVASGPVHVVLRNDDVTTMEFVVAMLREVFELDPDAAHAVMRATHEAGRAVVGRFPSAEATTLVETARRRAAAAGFPLWVGVEPC